MAREGWDLLWGCYIGMLVLSPHLARQLHPPSASSQPTAPFPPLPGPPHASWRSKVTLGTSSVKQHPTQPRSSATSGQQCWSHWTRCWKPCRLGHIPAQTPHRLTPKPSWSHPTAHPTQMLCFALPTHRFQAMQTFASLPGVPFPKGTGAAPLRGASRAASSLSRDQE